jgi:hypothetical protein
MDSQKVGIRPDIGVLSVLKHLNYKPWYALAEYVDNSIDSYLKNTEALHSLHGDRYTLRVRIDIDAASGHIIITDNAAGIGDQDLERALKMAEAPPDKSKLSEFGMGMKAASCWFSSTWRVRTKALGEPYAKTISFDVDEIVKHKTYDLAVVTEEKPAQDHYTRIELLDVPNLPVRGTITKIKAHLKSIYREFLRRGKLDIILNSEKLAYEEPLILRAPLYTEEDGIDRLWRKDIRFECAGGRTVRGFAAIRDKASTADAGFALFRRGRVIEGSAEDGFRPEELFGQANSFRYQRVFGELHLDGFSVSHTKDGFQWDECQEEFLDKLRTALDTAVMPILRQADHYRKRLPKAADIKGEAQKAVNSTAAAMSEVAGDLARMRSHSPKGKDEPLPVRQVDAASHREIEVFLNDTIWRIHIELSADPAQVEWVEVGSHLLPSSQLITPEIRRVGIRLSLSHPFTTRFAGVGYSQIEPLLRMAAALGLSEVVARESGLPKAGVIKEYVNELLGGSLSKP